MKFSSFIFVISSFFVTFVSSASIAATTMESTTALIQGHSQVPTVTSPFGVVFSADGKYLFAAGSISGGLTIQTYTVSNGIPTPLRTVNYLTSDSSVNRAGYGVSISHDGSLLAVAQDAGVGIYSVSALIAGTSASLGNLVPGAAQCSPTSPGTIEVGFSLDDSVLVSSNEWQKNVSVYKVSQIRNPAQFNNALIATIPTGALPVGFAFNQGSNGHQQMFFTTEYTDDPSTCSAPTTVAPGTLTKVDLTALLNTPPATPTAALGQGVVMSVTPAGLVPVRVDVLNSTATTPAYSRSYVTARGEDNVLVFDNSTLSTTSTPLYTIPVGSAPVGIKLTTDQRYAIVADSNRFATGTGQISIIDTGINQVTFTLQTLKFPRDIAVSPDGSTVVVADYGSATLEVLNVPLILSTAANTTPTPVPPSIVTYALTVTSANGGTITSNPAGINCGTICSVNLNSGTVVTLSATPASGFAFTGWGSACSGTGTCAINMNAAKNITATFVQTVYALSVGLTGVGAGTVSSNPTSIKCTSGTCSANFNSGTAVTLSAVPATGSIFTGWGGACSGTASCTVSMSAAQSVTAAFGSAVQPTPTTGSCSTSDTRALSASCVRLVPANTSNNNLYFYLPTYGYSNASFTLKNVAGAYTVYAQAGTWAYPTAYTYTNSVATGSAPLTFNMPTNGQSYVYVTLVPSILGSTANVQGIPLK